MRVVMTSLLFAAASAASQPRRFESSMWFWGGYDGKTDVVSDSIWSEIASKHIATNLFVGFGHAMHSGGNAGVASEAASNRTALLVTKAHSANVTVQPLIEYWTDGS